MHLYYHLDREGQESCAIFTDEILMEGADKKRNFATNWQREKLALARETQGVSPAHTDEGLVYANQHTDTVTSTSTAPTPGYLTLVKQELDKYVTHQKKLPPRGRHAKHSIEACRAGRVKKQRWNDLPGGEKERLTLDYAFRSESVAFTLNLTPKKQAQLMKSDRPARLLADAINRAAKRILGYAAPISLALEVTGNGRLHAHGIVTLQRREGKAFCKALKSAGGKVHGCGAGRQTDIRKLWSATGWTRYLAKDFDRTAEALGTDKIHYQCRATVQGARRV